MLCKSQTFFNGHIAFDVLFFSLLCNLLVSFNYFVAFGPPLIRGFEVLLKLLGEARGCPFGRSRNELEKAVLQ